MRFLIASLISLIALTGSATADTKKQEVPANKGAVVDAIGYFNRATCGSSAMPKVTIRKQPAHGKLIIKKTTSPIGRKNTICKGKKINAVYVFYKPNKGYRGKDEASINFKILGNGSRNTHGGHTYKLTVK
ncbi:hypothetical protein PsAD2_04476 [Pseudovibrio axinellae]|uniref:Uncharacterized protein n=1 Tax=Pseudovibrio axinellae TaxID=989403 RepID=A0A165T0D9_9HYPH|nr:hypothetical protein [Pseudovibrio axinellae]KZL05121.1 hypothetical protein PsAD2_04476 [Pseudovibrio axinellae]SER48987.1 hypothetical protein SAMN05421798_11137 [Pseudovibrio axinellae]